MPERPPQLPSEEVAEKEYVGRGGPANGNRIDYDLHPINRDGNDASTDWQHESHSVEWAQVDAKASMKPVAETFVYETEPEIPDAVAERIRRDVRGTEIRLGLRRRRDSNRRR